MWNKSVLGAILHISSTQRSRCQQAASQMRLLDVCMRKLWTPLWKLPQKSWKPWNPYIEKYYYDIYLSLFISLTVFTIFATVFTPVFTPASQFSHISYIMRAGECSLLVRDGLHHCSFFDGQQFRCPPPLDGSNRSCCCLHLLWSVTARRPVGVDSSWVRFKYGREFIWKWTYLKRVSKLFRRVSTGTPPWEMEVPLQVTRVSSCMSRPPIPQSQCWEPRRTSQDKRGDKPDLTQHCISGEWGGSGR